MAGPGGVRRERRLLVRVRRRGGSSERGLLERGAAASARLRQTKRRRGSARLHQGTHAVELEKKAAGRLCSAAG